MKRISSFHGTTAKHGFVLLCDVWRSDASVYNIYDLLMLQEKFEYTKHENDENLPMQMGSI